ncbi:hypothetical protein [Pedobacter cryophilus]|uniref:Uncharacterized protein n=1 Tax=Pedobacter cryophilus TaxID=2571271 RepID=A0A4V5NYR6_9SPHI|nr:hypothetical protein [Pedobacter cryophilus]TKB96870.1 hypothetical protein FA046_12390 [Pedobacter cryophilus]
MHNLTVPEWNLDSNLLFRSICIKEIKEAQNKKPFAQTGFDFMELETKISFFTKGKANAEKHIDSFLKSPDYSIEPFLQMMPTYTKHMTEEEHAALQNRYYLTIKKIADLESIIKKTLCPVKLALFNTDMRLLITEKENVYQTIIEWKH